MTRDDDAAVPMRDGVALLAVVHRPREPGRYPVLIALRRIRGPHARRLALPIHRRGIETRCLVSTEIDPLLKRLHLANARRVWRDLVGSPRSVRCSRPTL